MVKTNSTMLPLGTQAPDFTLRDVISGQLVRLHQNTPEVATVIFFICNHCPYVKHINSELTRLAHDYQSSQVRFIAINSNDADAYPDDAPEKMFETAKVHHYPFPYLFDETQEVAKAYQAACTPDFFIFDKALLLVYRGQFDESRPGGELKPDGSSVRAALDALLQDRLVPETQKPSVGCNIKWRA